MSNLRWRAFFFLNPSNASTKETFNFKTTTPAPSVPEVKGLETAMYELVKNVKFKQNVTNTLQNTLKENIREMNRDDRMYVAADKTHNFYKVTKENYMNTRTRQPTRFNEQRI